jgi:hypothetical protein
MAAPCPRGTQTSWPWKCPTQVSGGGVGFGGAGLTFVGERLGVGAGDVAFPDPAVAVAVGADLEGCGAADLTRGGVALPPADVAGGIVPHPASASARTADGTARTRPRRPGRPRGSRWTRITRRSSAHDRVDRGGRAGKELSGQV